MTRSGHGTRRGVSRPCVQGRLGGLAAAGVALLAVMAVPVIAQDDPGRPDRPPREKSEDPERRDRRESEDPFKDLSPEERERVRRAFHEAWTDPAVEAARERMREAGEAYKEALREAMSRVDPDLREVMERMMRDRSRRDFHRGGARRPPLFRMDDVPGNLRAKAEELTEALSKDAEAGRLLGKMMQAESREDRDRLFDEVGAHVRRFVEAAEPALVPFIVVPDRERFPWRPPGSNGRRGDRPPTAPAEGDGSPPPDPAPKS